MHCFICAQQNKDSIAIAMCIVCGMALCNEHLIRLDIDIWEGSYPIPRHKTQKKLPRILCQECYNACQECHGALK